MTSADGPSPDADGADAADEVASDAPDAPDSFRLVIGWYTATALSAAGTDSYWEAFAGAGVTTLIGDSADASLNPDFSWTAEFLRRADQRGIRVLVSLPRDLVRSVDTAALQDFARVCAASPACYGYNMDEPDVDGEITAESFAQVYGAVKTVDPVHPMATKLLTRTYDPYCRFEQSAPQWFASTDLITYDYYPVRDGSVEFEIHVPPELNGNDGVFLYTQQAGDCAASARDNGKQGPIAILQGFGYEQGTTNPQYGCRDPTYGEVRYMLYTSLARDGMGAVFWIDYRANAGIRATVDSVICEASSLGPAIAGGQFRSPLIEVSEPLVGYKYCVDGTDRYLIAINESSRDSQFEVEPPRPLEDVDFVLPPGLDATSVLVLYDRRDAATGQYVERSLPLESDGSGRLHFVDSFDVYEVHVYQIL